MACNTGLQVGVIAETVSLSTRNGMQMSIHTWADKQAGKNKKEKKRKKTQCVTSNDEATAVRQQNMATSLSQLGYMVWCIGVAGQVVDGSHLTLCAIVHLRINCLRRRIVHSHAYACMRSWGGQKLKVMHETWYAVLLAILACHSTAHHEHTAASSCSRLILP